MEGQRKPTVANLNFSRRLRFPYGGQGTVEEYVAALGPRPKPDLLKLPEECYYDEPALRGQIRNSSVSLMMDGIDHKEGPYADRKHALENLADDVFRDSDGTALDNIEKVMDRLRPSDASPAERMLPRRHGFGKFSPFFDSQLLVPGEIPVAGLIMSQEERHVGDRFALVHPIEPYIVACSLLRMKGILAYPSRAFTGEDGEDAFVPLITVFQSDQSIATFRMLRVHPDIENIEIWSDTAVMGALHAMKAVTLANDLAVQDVTLFLEGKELSEGILEKHLSSIAGELRSTFQKFVLPSEETHHLAAVTMQAVFSHIYQAEAWKGIIGAFRTATPAEDGPDLFLQSRGITFAVPLLPIDQSHARMFLECDESIADRYPNLRPRILRAWENAERNAQQAVHWIMHLFEE